MLRFLYLLVLILITSVTYGISKPLCKVLLETYQGALLIILSIFDWHVWRILVLDGLLHPHSSIPYVQMGRSIVLHTVSLLSLLNWSNKFERRLVFSTFRLAKIAVSLFHFLRCCTRTSRNADTVLLWIIILSFVVARTVYYVPAVVTLGYSTRHLVPGLDADVLAGGKKTPQLTTWIMGHNTRWIRRSRRSVASCVAIPYVTHRISSTIKILSIVWRKVEREKVHMM